MDQSENIGQLALALSKTQAKLNGAAKSSDNPFFKSKYADLFECIEAAKSPLSENELAVVQTTDTDVKGIWVYTTLIHSSGEWIRGRILMKPKKDDDQSTGSSITYGRRYGFAAIVGLSQKDDDGNASCNENNSENKQNNTDKKKQDNSDKKQTAAKKLTAADWIKVFDTDLLMSNDKTAEGVKAWRLRRGKEIMATIAGEEDADKLKGYLNEMEAEYTILKCPETDAQVTAASCAGKQCKIGCPEFTK